jgi:hypothetical protein
LVKDFARFFCGVAFHVLFAVGLLFGLGMDISLNASSDALGDSGGCVSRELVIDRLFALFRPAW